LSAQLRLCLTGNEPRQRYLFQALAEIARVEAVVPFDEIDDCVLPDAVRKPRATRLRLVDR
jgi:hypothetical protein